MTESGRCARCGRVARRRYDMKSPEGVRTLCLRCALRHPPLVRRAAGTAIVVGSVLTTINQLDVLIGGAVTSRLILKVGLTYVVPYVVTTWGALGNAARVG